MARTANIRHEEFDGSTVPYKADGSVDVGRTWRDSDGTLYHFNKEAKSVPVVFSISASCSEKFNGAIEAALANHNNGRKESGNSEDSRAEFIRVVMADKIGYDLSQEPESERGGGLEAYRERVKQATSTMAVLAGLAESNPELLEQLRAAGVPV